MRNMLAAGVATLASKMKAHAGVAAVYRRPAGNHPAKEKPVVVTLSRSVLKVEGSVIRTENDCLLPFADIATDFGLPMPGDTITLTNAGVTFTYEVRPPSEIDECYRLDPQAQLLRIFTKLYGTASPSA